MQGKENLPPQILEVQKEQITSLLHAEPKQIFLFSGGIAKDKRGSFHATTIADGDFADSDAFGYLGGVYRMLATVELAKIFPKADIVTTSIDAKTGISHAQVYAKQLEQHGVASKRITLEEKSVATRGEIKEMIKLVLAKEWSGPVAIVANNYHIPRILETYLNIEALIGDEDSSFKNDFEEFVSRGITVLFAPAEDVLNIVDKRYGHYFETLKNPSLRRVKNKKNEAFFKRIKDAIDLRQKWEESGIEAIRRGNYVKRPS